MLDYDRAWDKFIYLPRQNPFELLMIFKHGTLFEPPRWLASCTVASSSLANRCIAEPPPSHANG